MPTKAKPLRNAQTRGGFIEPFRLSDESRAKLSALGWTEGMCAELDRRVTNARFDTSFVAPTGSEIVAAVESLGKVATNLYEELKGLDWQTRYILENNIRQYLSDVGRSSPSLLQDLQAGAMEVSILINAMLRHPSRPRSKRGAPPKRLNNAVALIVREIMLKYGHEPMAEGGSAAIATALTLEALSVPVPETARRRNRRAKPRR